MTAHRGHNSPHMLGTELVHSRQGQGHGGMPGRALGLTGTDPVTHMGTLVKVPMCQVAFHHVETAEEVLFCWAQQQRACQHHCFLFNSDMMAQKFAL